MNHYSRIYSQVWADKKFLGLSSDERVMFIYFLSAPASNMAGYYWLPMMYALNDLQWGERRFKAALGRLESLDMVHYDEANSVLFVKNFMRHNVIKSAPQVIGALNAVMSVPASPLIHKFMESWGKYIPPAFDIKTSELAEYIKTLGVAEDGMSEPAKYPADTV